MTPSSSPPLEDFTSALDKARATLENSPDDPAALRQAAEASAGLDLDEAIGWYEKLVAVEPLDVDAWRGLADELVSIGEEDRANRALRRGVDIAPTHTGLLTDLALLEHRAGRAAEAIDLLNRALDSSPGNKDLLRNLVDMHLAKGQTESALSRAEELAEVAPDDVIVHLDIAEIALSMGDYVKASRTFERLRRVDDADGHLAYAYHGMFEAEVLLHQWRLALNAAIDATAVDRNEFTTDLLLYVSAQVFGVTDKAREPKPWEELSADLARERAEHRRFHIEQAIL